MIRAQGTVNPDAVGWSSAGDTAMVYLGMITLVSGLFIVGGIQVARLVENRIDPEMSALNRSAGLDI
ncbi:hypothetical protein [Gluconacetobacter tumulisoli]|uniref:Uncharacterized protein n=1 Tax=Gluconacetobacter tumulisoli TaxID=1286189 RepID=A0A7W4PMT0_9PROT|nr:hypothetical protein [Gluconacetobacter tumulisoli]MBB2200111.1 hypothetical protein [Gluconacetobacter tumulisoli]